MTSAPSTADTVEGSRQPSGVGLITLNRPKALNAMDLDMDVAYRTFLEQWEADPNTKAVVIQGSTPRAFCSGLDVKWFAAAIKADKRTNFVHKVFQTEYSLICYISKYSKPYISIVDGITMGFGIGLSGHGRYRVITEKTVMAMPENGIGLFPDVGFAYLIAKAPEAVGLYLGLTGARLKTPADIMFCGLASHYVPSEKLPELRKALFEGTPKGDGAVEGLLNQFAEAADKTSSLAKLLPAIKRCFGPSKTVLQTREALLKEEDSSDPEVAAWAKEALGGLSKGAPLSLEVTHRHFTQVAKAVRTGNSELTTVEGVMRHEYRLAIRTSLRHDFVEGVRAVLVDKDQNPEWQPAALEEVDPAEVAACFAPFDNAEEELKARL